MRVLVLGNSHAASLRRAFAQIAPLYPNVELTFWGLPGGAFDKARQDHNGILRPAEGDGFSLRKCQDWGIPPEIDLAPFEQIFLVGLRLDHQDLRQFLRDYQPLDYGPRPGTLGISTGFLKAALYSATLTRLQAQAKRIAFDHRFTVLPAPSPAACVLSAGPFYEPLTAAVARLPAADTLYQTMIAQARLAHAALGLRFTPQPAPTLAQPWLSGDAWLEDPTRDARHMNAAYGALAFQSLMQAAHPFPTATESAEHV